jgi:cytochrome c oxidase cbb3-type subunit 4
MSTYETMRQFSDSWGLLAMFAVFAVVVVRVLMPGMKDQAQDASMIPFKDYDADEDK